jgi:hypothetical protein
LLRDDIRELIEGNYRIVYQLFEDRLVALTVFEGHLLLPREKVNSSVCGDIPFGNSVDFHNRQKSELISDILWYRNLSFTFYTQHFSALHRYYFD